MAGRGARRGPVLRGGLLPLGRAGFLGAAVGDDGGSRCRAAGRREARAVSGSGAGALGAVPGRAYRPIVVRRRGCSRRVLGAGREVSESTSDKASEHERTLLWASACRRCWRCAGGARARGVRREPAVLNWGTGCAGAVREARLCCGRAGGCSLAMRDGRWPQCFANKREAPAQHGGAVRIVASNRQGADAASGGLGPRLAAYREQPSQ